LSPEIAAKAPKDAQPFFPSAQAIAAPYIKAGKWHTFSGSEPIVDGMPIYLFPESEDPVGQRLEGVATLVRRYRQAGLFNISHDFYGGGRQEMLNETNRGEVLANLLNWLCAQLAPAEPSIFSRASGKSQLHGKRVVIGSRHGATDLRSTRADRSSRKDPIDRSTRLEERVRFCWRTVFR
jgi:hypothetical protein